jgi:hypothetical protein
MAGNGGETEAAARVEELCLVQDGLSVETWRAGARLDSRLAGVAELAVGRQLAGYLRALHGLAHAGRVKHVVVDLVRLEFMNASCFRAFVSWIQELQELPRTGQYTVCFRSNPDLPWQRRSINALRCFATDLITVEVGA